MYRNKNNSCNEQGPINKWYRPDPCDDIDVEKKNIFNIDNCVCIDQSINSETGDGGDGGDAEGGDAATASSGLLAVAINEIEADIEIPIGDAAAAPAAEEDEVGTLQAEPASAEGGDGTGGQGGNSGSVGTSTNVATVEINNVIVLPGNEPSGAVFNIGMNGRKFDLQMDEEGNTFINGKKMDEVPLEDGTKVYLFRTSDSKKQKK